MSLAKVYSCVLLERQLERAGNLNPKLKRQKISQAITLKLNSDLHKQEETQEFVKYVINHYN